MMERAQILKVIRPFFDIDELVCDHALAKFGEAAWEFLDTNYLHCLLVIRRDILRSPMYCNGRGATQRGLRCNMCQLVKSKTYTYISAHILGKAGDFDVKGMTAEQARRLIIERQELLPCPIRLEKDVSWLHFDTRSEDNKTGKVTLFRG